MDRITISQIFDVKELLSELELEKASSLYLRLRPVEKENIDYPKIRKHLKELILAYEKKHWSDFDNISDEQMRESDLAELIVEAENEFYYKRKKLIKSRLKAEGLSQNDLAQILGHRKSYMSELINGLRPFSKEDTVILNRLFKIQLKDLIPTFIKQEKVSNINQVLINLNKEELTLSTRDLISR
ncbi:MAG: helix-turn-helix domain-containing protein [Candidatus Hodarchaeales archaeon]